jgi:hypothetical protein
LASIKGQLNPAFAVSAPKDWFANAAINADRLPAKQLATSVEDLDILAALVSMKF